MTRRKTALADVPGPECSIKESIHSASLSGIFTATRRASPPFGFNGGRGIALTFAHFEGNVVDTPRNPPRRAVRRAAARRNYKIRPLPSGPFGVPQARTATPQLERA